MGLGPGEHAGRVAEASARGRALAARLGEAVDLGAGRGIAWARRRWRNGSSAGCSAPRRRSRAGGPRRAGASCGRKPSRFMPLSTLSQTVSGRSRRAASSIASWPGSWTAISKPSRAHKGSSSASNTPSMSRIGWTAPASRKASASSMQATPSMSALGQRRQQAGGAVAVAVGLDDRDDLGPGAAARAPRARLWRRAARSMVAVAARISGAR